MSNPYAALSKHTKAQHERNPANESDDAPGIPPPQSEDRREHPVLYWIKRLLICNPFYLASAALLLYGISRLTESPDFPTELRQLLFNFGALEAYELLLVITAIALARRAVWYDSTLLVGLESLFVLIPFILVSQAAFLGDDVARLICGLGGLLAAGRFWSLRQFYPQLNLPNRLLQLGVLFLLINIAMPLLCTSRHQLSPGSVEQWSFAGWIVLMPALAFLGNLPPRPKHWGGTAPQRSWLPLGFLAIWVAVTGYHLFRLSYVYDLVWQDALFAPGFWAVAWTLCNRLTDFQPEPRPALRTASLLLPCAVTVLGLWYSDSSIFFVLSALNAVMFAFLAYRDRTNRLAFQLALVSLAAMLGGFPEALGNLVLPQYGRQEYVEVAIGGYFILQALLSRNPAAGVIGAIGLAVGTSQLLAHVAHVESFALQNGLVFALVHSLRWDDKKDSSYSVLRWFGVLLWLMHSALWTINAGDAAAWPLLIYAAMVLGASGFARLLCGVWGPIVIPGSALVVLAMTPARLTIELLSHASIGMLALLASLLLFAIGTVLAWTKDKWHRPESRGASSPAP